MVENGMVVAKGQNALQSIASRLKLDPETMKTTLKATAFKDCKTDEEFVAAIIVANEYGLNPLTKEIYAFAGKSGGVVPVVSTDGWTHLMVNHPKYKNHTFIYSEKLVTMKGAKPCPEWCEIHIEKIDGSISVVREYLDEVFRDLSYANAWQTHTKRFLRHKTKIQGARETFGFGGIYDEDEAERIIEAEILKPEAKPTTEAPKTIAEAAQQPAEKTDEIILSEVTGTVLKISPRPFKSKDIMQPHTFYTVKSDEIGEIEIQTWAEPVGAVKVGEGCIAKNVKVGEYKSKVTYTADSIDVDIPFGE